MKMKLLRDLLTRRSSVSIWIWIFVSLASLLVQLEVAGSRSLQRYAAPVTTKTQKISSDSCQTSSELRNSSAELVGWFSRLALFRPDMAR